VVATSGALVSNVDALVELFCDMTPAEATAAARGNLDTAAVIRFR
jgi:hypothetical protein